MRAWKVGVMRGMRGYDHGVRAHAVWEDSHRAACGKLPKPGSQGWIFTPSGYRSVDCARCLTRLTHSVTKRSQS